MITIYRELDKDEAKRIKGEVAKEAKNAVIIVRVDRSSGLYELIVQEQSNYTK